MSQSPNPNSDQVLTSIYSQQVGLYEQLTRMSDGLAQALTQRQGTDIILADMNKVMNQITLLNQQLAPIREQWSSSGCQPSAELARTIKHVEKLIVGVIKQIDGAESSARDAKNAMVPTMSEENAKRRMRAAYTSASRNE